MQLYARSEAATGHSTRSQNGQPSMKRRRLEEQAIPVCLNANNFS